eukprot:m.55613 g.55613  ORF g.55613 m.55613 type:complete len:66 (+) comp7759_c0_seq2:225-422(+)
MNVQMRECGRRGNAVQRMREGRGGERKGIVVREGGGLRCYEESQIHILVVTLLKQPRNNLFGSCL